MANAQVYISGRYHPAIMASLGGTPCVFMGSNSHKTWSLQSLLEYDNVIEYSPIPNEIEIAQIISDALKVANDNVLRSKIRARAKALGEQAIKMKDLIE